MNKEDCLIHAQKCAKNQAKRDIEDLEFDSPKELKSDLEFDSVKNVLGLDWDVDLTEFDEDEESLEEAIIELENKYSESYEAELERLLDELKKSPDFWIDTTGYWYEKRRKIPKDAELIKEINNYGPNKRSRADFCYVEVEVYKDSNGLYWSKKSAYKPNPANVGQFYRDDNIVEKDVDLEESNLCCLTWFDKEDLQV